MKGLIYIGLLFGAGVLAVFVVYGQVLSAMLAGF